MALKTLMLRHDLDLSRSLLAAMDGEAEKLAAREAELEATIAEVTTDEERSAVDAAVTEYENAKAAHEEKRTALESKIAELEQQLAAEEEKQRSAAVPAAGKKEDTPMDTTTINIRSLPMGQRAFEAAYTPEQRSAIVAQPDVKQLLAEIRTAAREHRDVTGGQLTIPRVMLALVAENMYRYSKLLRHVRVQRVTGDSRQPVAGLIPEAVWTEMCGAINELTLGFSAIDLDGYKVAGFIPVCNALLDDNDVNLYAFLVEAMAESVGLAVDKAIIYGKGSASKMPLGFVTRLAQTSKPSGYPDTAPAWTDLHSSNVLTISSDLTGAAFWAALSAATAAIYNRYARGEIFWAMNSKTLAALRSKAITFTASGDVVANVYNTLPVITGNVEILEFIPDNDIVGGFGDLYIWGDRQSITVDADRSVQFLRDQTVFRGKARGDGQPIIAAGFVAINIAGSSPTTTATFAADTANDAKLSTLSVGGETLSPTFDADVTSYAVTASGTTGQVNATAAQADAVVTATYNDAVINIGKTITFVSGTKNLVITVKHGAATKVYTVAITKT